MLSTYIMGIEDDVKKDGRVHPDTLLHGTRTGRVSYKNPPLQTIPKETGVGEDLARVRLLFVGGGPGRLILEADYQQAELRVGCNLSEDPQMAADIKSEDYHRQAASSIFNVVPAEVTALQRYESKFVTFGLMFGRGAKSLAKGELNTTFSVAQRYKNNWYKRYKVFGAWQSELVTEAKEMGEVVTPFGRKRRFPLIQGGDFLGQIYNFPIQSTSHDFLLTSFIALHPRLAELDSYLLFEVHDSILIDVNTNHLDDVVGLIKEVMEAPRVGLPGIPVEIKVGPNWLEATKV